MLSACGARSADDRVRAPRAPVQDLDARAQNYVAVTVPSERYQLRGNTLYVGRGYEVVYVVPDRLQHTDALAELHAQDTRVDAYLDDLATEAARTGAAAAEPSPSPSPQSGPIAPDPQRGVRAATAGER